MLRREVRAWALWRSTPDVLPFAALWAPFWLSLIVRSLSLPLIDLAGRWGAYRPNSLYVTSLEARIRRGLPHHRARARRQVWAGIGSCQESGASAQNGCL